MKIEGVAALASEQKGLFTTAQAARLGVDRVTIHRSVRNGVVRNIRRGVFAFESAPFSPDEELRAAWLSLDPSRTVAERLQTPGALVVSTTSAAQQYGIGDFETPQHEFYSSARKQARADDIRLRIRNLDIEEVEIREGLPLSTPTRIILDLLSERQDLVHISRLISDAVRQGLKIDWSRIAAHSDELAGNYHLSGVGLIQALAESSESTADTALAVISMLRSDLVLSEKFRKSLADSAGSISRYLTGLYLPIVLPDVAGQLHQQLGEEEVGSNLNE